MTPVRLVKIEKAICEVEDCTNTVVYEVTGYTRCMHEPYYAYLCLHHTIFEIDNEIKLEIKWLEKKDPDNTERLEYLRDMLQLGHQLKIPTLLKKDKHLCGD